MATPTAARELYEALKQAGVTIDVLVNNAGFGTYGRFCDTELATEEREIQLNAVTPTQMCKLFMQDMIAADAAISSTWPRWRPSCPAPI